MIFEKLAEILADYKGIDVADIKMETSFADLGFDSLDTVDLLMSLEDEFGVEVEMDPNIKTVADVVEIIKNKQEA